jgi:hypothetical protein
MRKGKSSLLDMATSARQPRKRAGSKGAQGGLWALLGQQLRELDVPENVEGIKGFRELNDKVRPHLRAKP